MKIKDVMNKAVAISHDISLKDAAKIMSDKNIGSLIAVKGEKILGLVTEKDIMNNVSDINKKVSSIMTKRVITIDQEQDIGEASMLMSSNKIKRLPVLKNDKLVGVITTTDLIAHLDDISDEFAFD